jgi:hypothetical protein
LVQAFPEKMSVSNTLAYFVPPGEMKKTMITLTLEANPIKLFMHKIA